MKNDFPFSSYPAPQGAPLEMRSPSRQYGGELRPHQPPTTKRQQREARQGGGIGLVPVLALLVFALSGLLTGLLFGATFPTHRPPPSTSSTASSGVGVPLSPQMPPRPTATPHASFPVAWDGFSRADALQFWGTASDGQVWEGDANRLPAFSIEQQTGVIAGQGTFNALLGPSEHDAEVTEIGSVGTFADGTNFGVVLRWVNTQHFYKAYIDGQNLVMIKRQGTHTQVLGRVPFPARAGVAYVVAFRASGGQFWAKGWESGAKAPSWMLSAVDPSVTWATGKGGIRALLSVNTSATVRSFVEVTPTGP